MTRERICLPRQAGKTTYLVERVQQAQDDGADLVAVVTCDEREATRWAKNVLEWEIDPSRFIVFSARQIEYGSRGLRVDYLFVDNADMLPPGLNLKEIEWSFAHGIDVVTFTG